jgi:hypothetical protein
MSTKRFLEITQSTVVPIPAWLLILGCGGIFTLAYHIHEGKSQLNALTKAVNNAWTVPMEREVWNSFVSVNRDEYPKLKAPNATQVFRDNN